MTRVAGVYLGIKRKATASTPAKGQACWMGWR